MRCKAAADASYSVYLLYWYKRTNTGQLANIYLTLCELCKFELPCEGIETAASLIPLSGGQKKNYTEPENLNEQPVAKIVLK